MTYLITALVLLVTPAEIAHAPLAKNHKCPKNQELMKRADKKEVCVLHHQP